ncbi:MAG: helix-turn-helix transcriptional regulator [Oscillospiraceae bacterium]|jgi:AraC-like DNA-binding protein
MRKFFARVGKVLDWKYLVTVLAAAFIVTNVFFSVGFYRKVKNDISSFRYSSAVSVSSSVVSFTKLCDMVTGGDSFRQCLSLQPSAGDDIKQLNHSAYLLQNELYRIISATGKSSGSIIVVFPGSQLTVTPTQFYTQHDYLARKTNGLFTTQDLIKTVETGYSWNTFFDDGHIWVIHGVSEDQYSEESETSALSSGSDRTAAFVIVELDKSQIIPSREEGDIAFIGCEAGLAYSSTPEVNSGNYLEYLTDASEDHEFRIGRGKYVAVCNVFSVTPLKVVVARPMRSFVNIGTAMQSNSTAVIAMMAELVILLLLLMRRRVKRIREEEEEKAKSYSSDLPYTVGNMLQIITNTGENENYLLRRCYDAAGMEEGGECFIIAFYVNDRNGMFKSPPGLALRSDSRTFVLYNMLQDMVYNTHAGVLCKVRDYDVALIEKNYGDTAEDMRKVIASLQTIYAEEFSTNLMASEPETATFGTFKKKFSKALGSISHKAFWFSGEEVPSAESSDEGSQLYYKLSSHFVYYLDRRDWDKAEGIFDEIMTRCLPSDPDKLSVAKSRAFSTLDTLISIGCPGRTDITSSNYSGIDRIRETGKKIFRELRDTAPAQESSDSERIASIKNYVLQNYKDKDLSVTSVAAHFDLNVTYLSRIFKESTGMNLLAFIHETRVEAAKECLKTMNVKKTSEATGFWDVQSFVRVFRKYEGVTPAEYRTKSID